MTNWNVEVTCEISLSFLGFLDTRRWDRWDVPKRRYGIITIRCIEGRRSNGNSMYQQAKHSEIPHPVHRIQWCVLCLSQNSEYFPASNLLAGSDNRDSALYCMVRSESWIRVILAFRQRSIFFIYTFLLPEGQRIEAWKLPKVTLFRESGGIA
jgi:hypothetical protein